MVKKILITDDYLWFIENKYADMVLATTEQVRVGYFVYEGVTMTDFMKALLERFKRTRIIRSSVRLVKWIRRYSRNSV